MRKLIIWLPDPDAEALARVARQADKGVETLAVEAIYNYLEANGEEVSCRPS